MSRTKASFSHLQLVEFEGRLAQKLRFHIFNSWKVKDVSQESFVFMNHGCDLNVRICTKHCVFSGKQRFRWGEKLVRVRDGLRHRLFSVECSRTARAVEVKVTFSLL